MVAYVYHMFKEHWCGDDVEYSNEVWSRQYSTNRDPSIMADFFQPDPNTWYTIWSHIAMNTAGARAHLVVLNAGHAFCKAMHCASARP